MNVRLFGVVAAMSAMGLVACGDDTGGGTGGGTGTGSGSGGEAATTAGTTSGTGGEDTTTAASTGSGGGETTTCGALCADDAGCSEDPPAPESSDPPDPEANCGDCIQEQADMGAGSACAAEGALGDCCQNFPSEDAADEDKVCAIYVSCVLGGGTQAECATDNAEGAGRARACVLSACGDCGSVD